MSETAIFIVGAIIFAITVYGAVVGGGLAFTRIELEQSRPSARAVDERSTEHPESR